MLLRKDLALGVVRTGSMRNFSARALSSADSSEFFWWLDRSEAGPFAGWVMKSFQSWHNSCVELQSRLTCGTQFLVLWEGDALSQRVLWPHLNILYLMCIRPIIGRVLLVLMRATAVIRIDHLPYGDGGCAKRKRAGLCLWDGLLLDQYEGVLLFCFTSAYALQSHSPLGVECFSIHGRQTFSSDLGCPFIITKLYA